MRGIILSIRNRIIILGSIEILLFLFLRPDNLKSFFIFCIILCIFSMGLKIFISGPYIPLIKERNSHMTGDVIENELKAPNKFMNFLNGDTVLLSYLAIIAMNLILYILLYFLEKINELY